MLNFLVQRYADRVERDKRSYPSRPVESFASYRRLGVLIEKQCEAAEIVRREQIVSTVEVSA
jgi:hypothetical protein